MLCRAHLLPAGRRAGGAPFAPPARPVALPAAPARPGRRTQLPGCAPARALLLDRSEGGARHDGQEEGPLGALMRFVAELFSPERPPTEEDELAHAEFEHEGHVSWAHSHIADRLVNEPTGRSASALRTAEDF